jgi:hypothetical protein
LRSGYLKSIENINELNYVFDARKLNNNDVTFIKNQFKDLFTTKKTDIFNTIWDNQELRNSLFPEIVTNPNITKPQLKLIFENRIENINSNLYGFIKVQ